MIFRTWLLFLVVPQTLSKLYDLSDQLPLQQLETVNGFPTSDPKTVTDNKVVETVADLQIVEPANIRPARKDAANVLDGPVLASERVLPSGDGHADPCETNEHIMNGEGAVPVDRFAPSIAYSEQGPVLPSADTFNVPDMSPDYFLKIEGGEPGGVGRLKAPAIQPPVVAAPPSGVTAAISAPGDAYFVPEAGIAKKKKEEADALKAEKLNETVVVNPRGPPGKPGMIFTGMSGAMGPVGPPGSHGHPGVQGKKGRQGASMIGLAGTPGAPGISGGKGPPGERGMPGWPGDEGVRGDPPEASHQWYKVIEYFAKTEEVMENHSMRLVRGVNEDLSMMQQAVSIHKARSAALASGSVDLHKHIMKSYKRMVKAGVRSQNIQKLVRAMPKNTPLDDLNDTQDLLRLTRSHKKIEDASKIWTNGKQVRRQQPPPASIVIRQDTGQVQGQPPTSQPPTSISGNQTSISEQPQTSSATQPLQTTEALGQNSTLNNSGLIRSNAGMKGFMWPLLLLLFAII